MYGQAHSIESLMKTAMESIKAMIDVNTVVGDAVETPDGNVIIPISRVTCGFGAGGGEFDFGGGQDDDSEKDKSQNQGTGSVPGFGGGSGAGVSVQPVGFLIAGNQQVRLIQVDGNAALDRIIDLAPQVIEQIQKLIDRRSDNYSEH